MTLKQLANIVQFVRIQTREKGKFALLDCECVCRGTYTGWKRFLDDSIIPLISIGDN